MTYKSTINRTLKFMLILCGIWPGTSCVTICRTYWITVLVIIELGHCRYFLMHCNDLFAMIDCFSSFLAQLKTMTKFIIFWLNKRKFLKILTMMKEDWNECSSSDVNMHKMTYKAKLADRITNALFILHMSSMIAFSMGALLADIDVTNHESELPLLIKVELPVDINTKRSYKILLTVQLVHAVMSSCGAGMINALLLTLTLHVGGQIDIVRSWFNEFVPKENEVSVVVTTNKIIRKHQQIISFSEYIEELYNHIALIQFISNTVLICLLSFLLVTAIGSPDATKRIVRILLFYTTTNLEAFIFCFAGEYMKNKSTDIGIAAYNFAWYKMKPKNSRNLIFVMLRAQKSMTLTVGKIMDLSLEAFTSIMKASGSYLSVLLAME